MDKKKAMSTYKKPYRTYQQQLELLKSRGLEITNDNVALEYLRRLGYYRLSGYWYPCRQLIPMISRLFDASLNEYRKIAGL
jgi:abortive infection bacteriophage resistance protein